MSKVVLQIPDYLIGRFELEFEKIIKKAKRLGVTPPSYKEIDVAYEKIKGNGWVSNNVPVYSMEISGEVPKLDGFEYLATVTHENNDKGEFLNDVEFAGFSRLSPELKKKLAESRRLKNCEPNCEHCNTKRDRNSTVFFRNLESGALVQVGSSCVDDFVGGSFLSKLSFLNSPLRGVIDIVDDYDPTLLNRNNELPLRVPSVLAVALMLHSFNESNGFVPSAAKDSTYSRVRKALMSTQEDAIVFHSDSVEGLKAFEGFLDIGDAFDVHTSDRVLTLTRQSSGEITYSSSGANMSRFLVDSNIVFVEKGSALDVILSNEVGAPEKHLEKARLFISGVLDDYSKSSRYNEKLDIASKALERGLLDVSNRSEFGCLASVISDHQDAEKNTFGSNNIEVVSEQLGDDGDKKRVVAEVVSIKEKTRTSFRGDLENYSEVLFITDEGNLLLWNASKAPDYLPIAVGDRRLFNTTVSDSSKCEWLANKLNKTVTLIKGMRDSSFKAAPAFSKSLDVESAANKSKVKM